MPDGSEVSPYMMKMLEISNSEVFVNGEPCSVVSDDRPHPIYTLPDRENPKSARYALTPYTLVHHSGIHFNPKQFRPVPKSDAVDEIVASKGQGPDLQDHFLVMDFDTYEKDGKTLTGKREPESMFDLIARMKSEGVPLPYCAVPTSTPGNFQLVWVLEHPTIRILCNTLKPIVTYWGGDPGFTNAVAWNPEYRVHHPQDRTGDVTHWWAEWTDTLPVLPYQSKLAGPGYRAADEEARTGTPTTPEAQRIQAVLKESKGYRKEPWRSMPLGDMVDGDRRKLRLADILRQAIAEGIREGLHSVPVDQLRQTAEEINQQFGQPLSDTEIASVVEPWTPRKQHDFIRDQKYARSRNYASTREHLLTELKWLKVCHVARHLAEREGLDVHKYTDPFGDMEVTTIHPDAGRWFDVVRAEQYPGRKVYRRQLTWDYIAWVAGYVTEETTEDGEVTRKPDGDGCKRLYHRAADRGYSVEGYLQKSVALDEAQKQAEARASF